MRSARMLTATAVMSREGTRELTVAAARAPRLVPAAGLRRPARMLAVLALALSATAAPAPGAEPEKAPPAAAAPSGYAGQEMCVACHAEAAESYDKTPHATALADEARPDALRGCEGCHGPGAAHAEAGGGKGVGDLQTFARSRPAAERAGVCLKCHAGDRGRHDFRRGPHATAGVPCTDCHRLHGGAGDALLARKQPDLCYGCHLEVRAKFSLPENHGVNRGAVSCLDCHDVHRARPFTPLRGTATNRECYRCHAEIEGPFVFEHAGLVTEGCVRCHDPHGSVNRHLLVRQQVGQVCYECHTVTPRSHLQPTYRDCTRCHVEIHGSNVDPRFLIE
jgi:DmsE family decaheme c-type cytochrome